MRRELSSPRWLSFVLSLSSSCCAFMTAQGLEELEIDSHEGFPLLFRTDLSPSLLLSFHLFCHLPLFPSSTHSPAPNPSLKPSPPLPFVLVLLAFSVSEELNKPLWRQTQVVASPFIDTIKEEAPPKDAAFILISNPACTRSGVCEHP